MKRSVDGPSYIDDSGIGLSSESSSDIVQKSREALPIVIDTIADHALDANLGGCGCGGSGNPMPSGGLTISDADKDTIFAWIEDGAEP